MNTPIPIFFCPMRKIILDDDKSFTQSILLKMHNKNFLAYNSPFEALHYLLHTYQPSIIKKDFFSLTPSLKNNSAQHSIDFCIEKIKNKMENHSSLEDINIIFVDYHMPDMCGLDFLKSISQLPIKKVLITGENDTTIAINAFNQGIIDAYIKKNDSNFLKKTYDIMSELEWKYFIDLSSVISDFPDFYYLNDPLFIQIFKKFIEDNNITEFYLTDIQGTFLLKTKEGKKIFFILRNKTQLKKLSQLAKEDGGSEKSIEKLENGKAILFFNDQKEPWEVPANQWEEFLYEANSSEDSDLVWLVIYE